MARELPLVGVVADLNDAESDRADSLVLTGTQLGVSVIQLIAGAHPTPTTRGGTRRPRAGDGLSGPRPTLQPPARQEKRAGRITGWKPVQLKEDLMALLRAFLKDSTEMLEWELGTKLNPDAVAVTFKNARMDEIVTVATTTGWVVIDTSAYAAVEIVR
jgi:hypothetical protein